MAHSPDNQIDEKVSPAHRIMDGDDALDEAAQLLGSTQDDRQDMSRMGKKQELMRNFRRISAFSFTVILTATWEYLLIANSQGLQNGGLAGLWWEWVWTFFGFGIIMISLAEMASMAPTCGGQYHWVSEFAPYAYQKPLSYLTGWMSVLSWQAGNASGSFLTGSIIQALISINNPNYDPKNWQETLLIFAMVLVLFISNIWGSRVMPLAQNVLLGFHIGLFITIVVVVWVKAPHNNADIVFTQFANEGGWSSLGVSLMIGQISAIYGSVGSDAPAHMAEEIRGAGANVPNAMVWSYMLNGFMATVILITYLFAITSLEDALNDPSDFPFIYVLQRALPQSGVNALTILIMLLVIAANIDYNASTSRQTFAFARDKGFPFHAWLGAVHPRLHIPVNAIATTCVITCLLALINIGSPVAFNAIISLQIVALMFSYTISITCVLYRRIAHPDLLPPARWSLGKWGIPVNSVALAYAIFSFFWCFWPAESSVDAESMNWGVVMFVGVGILCTISNFQKEDTAYRWDETDLTSSIAI
ncbi:hypothetical protein B7494_g6341 [Chlorociboria aeruginascens]|nr:hypothetical protein B7494_g6341 [Chlorociboria aeruginascens]